MITIILLWWWLVLIPTPFKYIGIFNRLGLTLLILLISEYFSNDLRIKLSEMYSKINLKNLIYSIIGVFIYLF